MRLSPPRLLAVTAMCLGLASFSLAAETSAMKNISPGQEIIPFALPDLQGNMFSSASLAGGPAAVVFWSTWSPRSGEILSDMTAYQKDYGPKGLKVVAINIETENLSAAQKGEIRDYAGRMGLPFPILLDEGLKTFAAYGVIVHPSALVCDASGKVTYILAGYPLSLRGELKDSILKVLGLYVEPPKEEPPSVGYLPQGGALQYYNLGRQLMNRGQPDKALDYFQKAADRDPAFMDPVIMLARVHFMLGDTDKAGELIKKISSDAINRSDVRFLLGYLLLRRDKATEAENVFKLVREKSSKEGWGYWGLGMAALARGDPSAALEQMEKGKELQGDNYEAESFLHDFLKKVWLRGETLPGEERFLSLFPSLQDQKDRYRKMQGGTGSGAASP